MFSGEKLCGRLTEVQDMTLGSLAVNDVFDFVNVDGVLVAQIMKHIVRGNRSWSWYREGGGGGGGGGQVNIMLAIG